MRILVVEDEQQIADFLRDVLEQEGYRVTHCTSIEEVLDHDYGMSHDFIILDLMLNGAPGDELVRMLRKAGSKIPILVLSALGQIQSKIDLINLGADDYMVKPFDAQELLARIRASHRRYLEINDVDEETHGDITFYWRQNKLKRGKDLIQLTKKEGELMHFLMQHKGQTVSIEDLLLKVWSSKPGYQSNVVPSTIRRLRRKIDSDYDHKLIENVHGIGYRLVLPK